VKGQNPRPEDAGSPEGLITDATALRAGDRVVYPNQGVCRVTGVEVKEIAGQKLELLRMEREEDGAAVMVPKAKLASIGLRRVATREYVEGVFHFLAAQADDPELDWKIRHRDNADRLITGGVLGIAEVVKELHALSRIRPLPTKEREQYDSSRHLLVAEISAALHVSPSIAEDYVDFALMPPAGTTFKLKPPPKPVELPVRLARRRPVAKSEDDISLDELGLELDAIPEIGEAAAEGEEGGEEKAEGGGTAEGAAPEGEGEAAAEAAPRAGKKGKAEAAPKGKKEPVKKAKAEPAKKAKAEKEPARKAKAEKPAPKKAAAKKPAGRGGKK
jgi:RNA polymerase-interacting CarD/CdnL/TRCF family regulator